MVINGDALLLESPIKDMLADKVRLHGVSHGLAEIGYDIRLKQDIHFWPTINRIRIGELNKEARDLDGRFCIASAMEEFDMPVNMMGIVHDKSTWARRGLSVFNTVIEPGWRGFLTLELVYHGQEMLHLPAGAGIAQVVFHRVMCSAQYQGKYQNQEDEPIPAILE
jgi:dCTP deaminase